MSTKKASDLTLWAILLIAFAFRFVFLALKPPHFDEGINGWFVDQMIATGYYKYDPTNYHGPLHFYLLLLFKSILGRNLWALRLSASAFGVAAVYVLARLEPYVGRVTALAAALFMAVSPGMTFYSRYGIHETGLLFFSILTLLGFFRFNAIKDKTSLWQIGLGLAGMITTKETFALHLGCFAIAFGCLKLFEKFAPRLGLAVDPVPESVPRQYRNQDLQLAFGGSLLFIVVFYSGFFQNMHGVIDIFKSFSVWFATGQKGNGHEKPFIYWFNLLKLYEVVAFAGLILVFKILFPCRRALRLIGIYGFGVFLAYSIIHYKTPWCIIEIIWPFLLVAASMLEDFSKHSKRAWQAAMALALIFAGIGTAKSISLNFYHYDDEQEPYAYVQTYRTILEINDRIQAVAKRDPSQYHMPIQVLLESNWPLPWMLGDFNQVSYAGPVFSGGLDGGVVFVDTKNRAKFEALAHKTYITQKFKLRAAQDESMVYYDATLFKDALGPNAPVFTPGAGSATQATAGGGAGASPHAPQNALSNSPLAAIFLPTADVFENIKGGAGLLASFYNNAVWMGDPLVSKEIATLDNFGQGKLVATMPISLKIQGQINIREGGPKKFLLKSEGGSDLFIDRKLVISNEYGTFNQTQSGAVTLTKGWHAIEVRYRSKGGPLKLRLTGAGSSGAEQPIKAKDLRSTRGDS